MLFPVMLALAAALLFGAATPASKHLLGTLSPFTLAGLLYLGAAGAAFPFARRALTPPWRLDRKNRRRLLGAIVAGGVVGPMLLLWGLRLASSASVSLWLNLELAATAVLGHLFFKDHLTRLGWGGVVLTTLAAGVLSWEGGSAGFAAGGLVLLGCACWGLDNHCTALIDGVAPSQSTFWKGLLAGLTNLTVGLVLEPRLPSWTVIGLALLVGALAYGASIVLYIRAAQAIGATRSQIVFATAPFFGVGLSCFLLGEPLGLEHAVASALFVAAIGLLTAESHDHAHAHEAVEHEHWHRHDDGHHTHSHPGLVASTRHFHRHAHDPVRHRHPHLPDLFHRHAHD